MSKSLVILISMFLLAPLGTTQSDNSEVLEVIVTGAGMTFPVGRHLYLRVRSGGALEYEDYRRRGRSEEFFVRRENVDSLQIADLMKLLDSQEVRSLSANYPPLGNCTDCSLDLTISIRRSGGSQTIVVQDFLPTSPKARTYPRALVDLLCRVERLRKNASYSIAARHAKWCP